MLFLILKYRIRKNQNNYDILNWNNPAFKQNSEMARLSLSLYHMLNPFEWL